MTNLEQASLVYVVDDDESVRQAVSSLIRAVGLQVRTFSSANEFIQGTKGALSDSACLVLDIRMPGMNGLDLQREVGRKIPIIFISGHGDIPMAVRAMKAGATEFLPKPFREQDLLDAISSALRVQEEKRGERESAAEIQRRYNTLTSREKEVLALILRGLRNKQSAAKLGIAEATVKVHRHKIMEKLKAPSLASLIVMLESLSGSLEEDSLR